MNIEILVHEAFQDNFNLDKWQQLVEHILVTQGVVSSAELSVVITDSEKMMALNKQYRDANEQTDVLAFSTRESTDNNEVPFVQPPNGILHLGEIVICYPQALMQAKEHGHSTNREIALLIIHGILHLLGFDHNTAELERQMRTREYAILKSIGKEVS